jgi:hypothetical protein
MPLLFFIFGLASVALLGMLLLSVILGAGLCISTRFRSIGIFVLLVPTLAACAAGSGSWGLAFLVDSISKSSASPEAYQRWQVLALWAWPAGFVVGGVIGAGAGVLISLLVLQRQRRRPLLSEAV